MNRFEQNSPCTVRHGCTLTKTHFDVGKNKTKTLLYNVKGGEMSRRTVNSSSRLCGRLLLAGMCIGSATLAHAQDLMQLAGGMNLGYTSFLDGFAPLNPGCIYLQYLRHNSWDEIHDKSGNNIKAFKSPEIDVTVAQPQLFCNTPVKIFGGTLGVEARIPVTDLHSSFDASGPELQDNGFGVGDFAIAPYVQMPPMIRDGRPVFSQRFSLYVNAPTGKFDSHKDINQGSGYWSVNPYWAATWLPDPKWELSWRLHYMYNFETSKIASSFIPNVGDVFQNGQAGQAAFVNFTLSYALTENFRLGLNGYYLKQLTDDKLNGQSYSGGKEEAFSVGPGFHYQFDAKNGLNFNAYLPVEDKNRPSGGSQFNLMYIHVF